MTASNGPAPLVEGETGPENFAATKPLILDPQCRATTDTLRPACGCWCHVQPVGNRRAREIAEARRPRPGDHMGGPVPWDRGQR